MLSISEEFGILYHICLSYTTPFLSALWVVIGLATGVKPERKTHEGSATEERAQFDRASSRRVQLLASNNK